MDSVLSISIWIVIFGFSIAIHESAHALTAWWLGDPTAKHQGRVSLNPLRHLDPLGLLFLLIVRFGWAKPVPINPKNFDHPRLHSALTAAAGPISNLLVALLSLYVLAFIPSSWLWANVFFGIGFQLNVLLAVFNLLPVFPLDGEKVFALFIPKKHHHAYDEFSRHGPLILFGIIGLQLVFGWNILGNIIFGMAGYVGSFLEFLVLF